MLLPPPRRWPRWSRDEQLNATYIVPSVFDPEVAKAVAAAVEQSARAEPGATVEVPADADR